MAEIDDWLQRHNLVKLSGLMADNDIDMEVLPELTEGDLKELGLSLGDRKRFLAALRSLHRAPPPAVEEETGRSASEAGSAGEEMTDARRQVTILFADLSGFTRLSSKLDPEEVHALLQRYFAVTDDIVTSFGGRIDKHIGDAVMAVFGAPVAHSNDPERAVRTALEIHRRLASFEPPLEAHIGIASGQVVASRTGSDSYEEYTVTGASVNLASRLQDIARSGEVVVSNEVHAALGRLAVAAPNGDVAVKGFPDPVRIWKVSGLGEVIGGTGDDRPFVGRARELRQLCTSVEETRQSRAGQLVLLRGEAGIGKTRLVDRVVEAAGQAGMACHTGLVLDFGAGKGREAVPALVRSLLDIPPGSGKTVRRAAADRAVAEGLVAERHVMHLYDFLDLRQPEHLRTAYQAMNHGTRLREQEGFLAALVRLSGQRQPLLLRIEDIHWADPVLLSRLSAVAAAIADSAVLMLMTTRLEGDPITPSWRSGIGSCPVVTIDLGPLNEADAAKMIRQTVGERGELAKACIAKAAGNPLFLDQLLRNAQESSTIGVPDSVQSIVQSRMDRLDPESLKAIRAAAVLGQRFVGEAVAFMIEKDDYSCSGLVAHHLVRPEGDGYLFHHALVRDGVYGTLLRRDRAHWHGRAAAWFADRDAVLHARHLAGAGDPAAGAAYLEAARGEIAAFRYEGALELAKSALAGDPPPAFLVGALCLKGRILGLLADSAAAIDCFREALKLARGPREEARCRLGLAAGMRILDRFDEGFQEIDAAQGLAETLGDGNLLAEIEFLRGNLCFPLGRTDDCLASHRRALDHARAAGNEELRVQALGGLGDASYARSRIPDARRAFAECVETAEQKGFGAIAVANMPMLGWTTLLSGDYRGCGPALDRALELARRAGNDRARIIVENGFAALYLDRGELDAAREHAGEIIRLSKRLGSARFLSYGLNSLAQVELESGDVGAARAAVGKALDVAKGKEISFAGPWIHATAARLSGSQQASREQLSKGEAMLNAGTVAHNHYFFRREALATCLQNEDWPELKRHASRFEAFLGPHNTSWSDFYIGRAKGLALVRQGRIAEETFPVLKPCLDYAEEQGLGLHLLAIREALRPSDDPSPS